MIGDIRDSEYWRRRCYRQRKQLRRFQALWNTHLRERDRHALWRSGFSHGVVQARRGPTVTILGLLLLLSWIAMVLMWWQS